MSGRRSKWMRRMLASDLADLATGIGPYKFRVTPRMRRRANKETP